MSCVISFSFDVLAFGINENKLQGLNIRDIEPRIIDLRHHSIVERKPNFRRQRGSGAIAIFRGARPVRIEAGASGSKLVGCLPEQSCAAQDRYCGNKKRPKHRVF